MSNPLLSRLGALSVAGLFILSAAQVAQADTFVGGTNVWTMIGPPSFPVIGINPTAATTFSNHLDVTVTES